MSVEGLLRGRKDVPPQGTIYHNDWDESQSEAKVISVTLGYINDVAGDSTVDLYDEEIQTLIRWCIARGILSGPLFCCGTPCLDDKGNMAMHLIIIQRTANAGSQVDRMEAIGNTWAECTRGNDGRVVNRHSVEENLQMAQLAA